MSRRAQLIVVLFMTLLIASASSHLVIRWSKIEIRPGKAWEIGPTNGHPAAYLAGSSLSGDGIAWDRVSAALAQRIRGWGVPGSSPWEWDAYQGKAPDATLTFVVVSAYDLNENFLCDFHANVVPVATTMKDLWHSRSGWHFAKRVLSQYPLKYVRILFPTAGRSRGLIGEIRDKLSAFLGRKSDSEAGPSFSMTQTATDSEYKNEKLSDWSRGKLLRRVSVLRGAGQGRQNFNGPKKEAFLRMLERGHKQGKVVVLVLPVSPAYARELLTPDATRQFEASLADVKAAVPAEWIRLDQLPGLSSNDYFWDIVHLNRRGQKLATEALLRELPRTSVRPEQVVVQP
jgi:hypothetical protein